MKNIFYLSLIAVTLYAYNDLGIYGQQYGIVEKNPLIYIKKAQQDFNKTKALNDIYQGYKNYMKIDMKIPVCIKNNKRIIDPTIKLKHNIDIPKYGIHIKKGTKFNPLKYRSAKGYILFINANKKTQLALAKRYSEQSMIIVTKGNLDKLEKIIKNPMGLYKANKYLIKSFHLRCVPTVYMQDKQKFVAIEYKIGEEK